MAHDTEAQMLGVREVFQLVEDALRSAGWNDVVVATEHGLFTWKQGAFPDRIVIHQRDGSVVVYHRGAHSRYTDEEWQGLKADLKGS